MIEPTPDRVREIIMDSLYEDLPEGTTEETLPEDAIIVQGILRRFAFDPDRINKHRQEIAEMLTHFDNTFYSESGGGWSFLNFCYTKDEKQWGQHQDMDALCVLAEALELGKYQMMEMKQIMPGGMPYFVIFEGEIENTRDKESYGRLRRVIAGISKYYEVGTTYVSIFKGSSINSLIKKANEFAKGKDWRMDIYYGSIYKDPDKVIYRGEKYVDVKRGSERD